jgi:hypothetical protein
MTAPESTLDLSDKLMNGDLSPSTAFVFYADDSILLGEPRIACEFLESVPC